MRSITYPALCLERPPFQFPLNAPRVERHREQVSDFACFNPPQVHSFLDRHAGAWLNSFPINIGCAFAIATVSYYLVERPVLRYRANRLRSRARSVLDHRA